MITQGMPKSRYLLSTRLIEAGSRRQILTTTYDDCDIFELLTIEFATELWGLLSHE